MGVAHAEDNAALFESILVTTTYFDRQARANYVYFGFPVTAARRGGGTADVRVCKWSEGKKCSLIILSDRSYNDA